jgi:phosphomannomutase
MSVIATLLSGLRANPPATLAGRTVESIDDLAAPTNGLPPTDGVRIWLSGGVRVIIRPSGTEAKMKCYIEVITKTSEEGAALLDELRAPLTAFLAG